MGLKRIAQLLIIAASMLLAACTANEEGKAREMVKEFYQVHQTNRPTGALTLKELITFRRFLSVPLFDLLKDVSVAQEALTTQAAADPDGDPPARLVQGDLFTGHPASASTFRIVSCEAQEREASCAVELIYSDAKLNAPIKWTDKVLLARDARGWVIDNIQYPGGAAPLRSGNLQDAMRKVLKRDSAPLQ